MPEKPPIYEPGQRNPLVDKKKATQIPDPKEVRGDNEKGLKIRQALSHIDEQAAERKKVANDLDIIARDLSEMYKKRDQEKADLLQEIEGYILQHGKDTLIGLGIEEFKGTAWKRMPPEKLNPLAKKINRIHIRLSKEQFQETERSETTQEEKPAAVIHAIGVDTIRGTEQAPSSTIINVGIEPIRAATPPVDDYETDDFALTTDHVTQTHSLEQLNQKIKKDLSADTPSYETKGNPQVADIVNELMPHYTNGEIVEKVEMVLALNPTTAADTKLACLYVLDLSKNDVTARSEHIKLFSYYRVNNYFREFITNHLSEDPRMLLGFLDQQEQDRGNIQVQYDTRELDVLFAAFKEGQAPSPKKSLHPVVEIARTSPEDTTIPPEKKSKSVDPTVRVTAIPVATVVTPTPPVAKKGFFGKIGRGLTAVGLFLGLTAGRATPDSNSIDGRHQETTTAAEQSKPKHTIETATREKDSAVSEKTQQAAAPEKKGIRGIYSVDGLRIEKHHSDAYTIVFEQAEGMGVIKALARTIAEADKVSPKEAIAIARKVVRESSNITNDNDLLQPIAKVPNLVHVGDKVVAAKKGGNWVIESMSVQQ